LTFDVVWADATRMTLSEIAERPILKCLGCGQRYGKSRRVGFE